jgi:hypothetical protein
VQASDEHFHSLGRPHVAEDAAEHTQTAELLGRQQ